MAGNNVSVNGMTGRENIKLIFAKRYSDVLIQGEEGAECEEGRC